MNNYNSLTCTKDFNFDTLVPVMTSREIKVKLVLLRSEVRVKMKEIDSLIAQWEVLEKKKEKLL